MANEIINTLNLKLNKNDSYEYSYFDFVQLFLFYLIFKHEF